ncbi:MAG: polysaccharide deacetylase family protein [Synergistaceae bacterium]|nr:polysaccharide deacetylase family protein [Synergistaceae bacterium]
MSVFLLFVALLPAAAEYRPCHKVAMTRTDTILGNGSVLSVRQAVTCLEDVDRELRSLTDNYVALYEPALAELSGEEAAGSRLDVGAAYSRTGTSWLSFMVSARVTLSGSVRTTAFATRTWDMNTGDRVTLRDLFEEKSAVWGIIEAGVRKAFLRYYPDVGCNTRAVEQLLRRENLYQAEFTLHGMSLVLHYPAARLFEGKSSIVQVPFYYPELYGHMTAKAFEQTDNKRYYRMLSLTYDNGPSRTSTPRLLNTLMEKGVRATFFISGSNLAQNVDLVQRQRDEGHAIGGHNWLHTDVGGWPTSAIRAIRRKVDAALTKAVGVPSAYNRAPSGRYGPLIASEAAWAIVQWSVSARDLSARSPEDILSDVARETEHGDIILCHDTNPRCDLYTAMIIDRLESDGYLFLTIDEMFAKDRVPFLNNLVYYRCAEGDFSEKR